MIKGTAAAIIFLLLFYLAVRAKAGNNQYRSEQAIVDSPMAEALTQLIGIAGGIYLSLIMGASFLGIEAPEKVIVLGAAIDPLAAASIGLALVQPILLCILRKF